jgi:hypothetical protein
MKATQQKASTAANMLLWSGVLLAANFQIMAQPRDSSTAAESRPNSNREQSPPTKVGEAGDPDRLDFEGLQTFTTEQIRHALLLRPSYLLASHPQANLEAFLLKLKDMIQTGYEAAGFPDVRVNVSYDAKTLRTRVTATEGPRFLAGQIRVLGAQASSSAELIRWLTTPTAESHSQDDTKPGVDASQRAGLNTPGKAKRSEHAMWTTGDPADFSVSWRTQVVAQVDSCLAEQGFFFSKATVELQRDATTGTASLLITLQSEGPSGAIGEIKVSGMKRNSRSDILGLLKLREGMKITGGRLAEAELKLQNCGRFWDYSLTPEYADGGTLTSRRVNLRIEVKEQEGVPRLGKPLSPTQQALVRLCEWMEKFPERDEDIRVTVSNKSGIPFAVELVLSPKHGLLLNSDDLQGTSPVSAGFLLTEATVQFCTWASGRKLSTPREGGGTFFLHVLPAKNSGADHFNLSLGAGFSSATRSAGDSTNQCLTFDVQLVRAAFLDILSRSGSTGRIEDGELVVSNSTFMLRAEAATGRLIGAVSSAHEPVFSIRCGGPTWDQAVLDFAQRAAPLTNIYAPGQGLASFLSLATIEAARWQLTASTNSTVSLEQRRLALTALSKLLNPELFLALDRFFGGDETNTFNVPMDATDQAVAQDSVTGFIAFYAFDYISGMFPKYSWPWTVARESAFVIMNQGRYTGDELGRLKDSADTGPIGCLAIAGVLAIVHSPAAKDFAGQGLTRLSDQDFLRDCNLFLRGESGLARNFTKLVQGLRTLPADELTALVAVLPEAEANLLRESADALRASPEAAPAEVLTPAISKYWQQSLRTKVQEPLRQLAATPEKSGSANN